MALVAAGRNANGPYEVAWSGMWAALLRVMMREHEQAETLAASALELAENNRVPPIAAFRCVLGQVRAELGRATEGIELIRQGIAALLEIGGLLDLPNITASLAEAQAREGGRLSAAGRFRRVHCAHARSENFAGAIAVSSAPNGTFGPNHLCRAMHRCHKCTQSEVDSKPLFSATKC
jgi:hypothetical protein